MNVFSVYINFIMFFSLLYSHTGLGKSICWEVLKEMIFIKQMSPVWGFLSDTRWKRLRNKPYILSVWFCIQSFLLNFCWLCRHGKRKCNIFMLVKPSFLKMYTHSGSYHSPRDNAYFGTVINVVLSSRSFGSEKFL